MKLFSGSSNLPLSQEVSALLKVPLSKAEVIRFGNSEVRVRIDENVKDEVCVIIHPTSNPTDTNLMELFFFCDALKRQEAQKVIGFLPYFGYARQDVQHREGECVSANVVIRFIESIGFNKIYTMDLHNEATEGAFSVPFKNVSTMSVLAERMKTFLKEKGVSNISNETVGILIPDQGALEQGRQFGHMLFGTDDFPLAVVEKKRDVHSMNNVTSFGLYGDVKGKHVVIVDDMIVSGGTLIAAIDYLLNEHKVKGVYAAMAHHDFVQDAPSKLAQSKIDKIFTTNTIQLRDDQKFDKLEEVSAAPVIAEELRYLV